MTIVIKIQPIKFLSIQLSDNSRSLSKYSIPSPRSDKKSNFRQNSVYLQMLQINLATSSLNHLIAGLVYFRSRISSPLARMSDLVQIEQSTQSKERFLIEQYRVGQSRTLCIAQVGYKLRNKMQDIGYSYCLYIFYFLFYFFSFMVFSFFFLLS